nr:histidine phosphatase family protein [Actinomycetales bacterium]
MTKTLVLMRHAKAEPEAGIGDRVRPLAQRGRLQSRCFGEELAEAAGPFDVALVSSALRTTETYRLLAGDLPEYPSPRVSDDLYEATTRSLLAKVRGLEESAQRVIVVGHEPVMSALAYLLDRGREGQQLAMGIPTAAAVVLDIPGTWAELDRQGASVRTVLRPAE